MTSQSHINRLNNARSRCDELEATMVEIQQKIERRRELLSGHIKQLQISLEKKQDSAEKTPQ